MTSFRITLTPNKRAAGRFIALVRRALQRALAEEKQKEGLTQSEIARKIGVHRSVVNRQLRGNEDMTLGRIAELAWAMNRKAIIQLVEQAQDRGVNRIEKIETVITNSSAKLSLDKERVSNSALENV